MEKKSFLSAMYAVFFSGWNLTSGLLSILVLVVAIAVGWRLFPAVKPIKPVAKVVWPSCLLEQDDGSMYPPMEQIPPGEYRLPSNLSGQGVDASVLAKIDAPFLIQTEEVALQHFKKYAEYVASLADGPQKDQLMVRLGVHWKKGDTSSSAVNAVSWEGAKDYALWLGLQTGCSYDLPSQAEWIATVSHMQSRDNIRLNSTVPTTGPLKNLLWGVREWSRTACASGYYLLGRDDLTADLDEGVAVCMPAMFSIAGFRVVMTPVTKQGSVASQETEQ